MAPNNFSEVHADVYQTDTSSIRGPGNAAPRKTQDALIASHTVGSGTLGFDKRGRIVYLRTSLTIPGPIPYETNLLLVDQETLAVLDSVALPSLANYFYIDNLNRVVVSSGIKIQIYEISHHQYNLVQSYDLSSVLLSTDVIASALPDDIGNIWFASQLGGVGYVQPSTGLICSTTLASSGGTADERVIKSFALDENGGVYIVSNFALYRFQVGSSSTPTSTWRTVYDRGTRLKSGQVFQGSGTTPTAFNDFDGNQFVTIADNADPYMHVNVYDRATGTLVAQQAVFTKFPYANSCYNSLIAVNHSVIIENNYGNIGLVEGGSAFGTTSGSLTSVPGLARVDFDPSDGSSEVVWTNYKISIPSAVTRLSTKNGLIYTYAKDEKSWYFGAVDFISGELCNKARVSPTGIMAGDYLANNFFSGVGIGRDKSAYVPTIGGICVWRANN
jgi:hypothetical protein